MASTTALLAAATFTLFSSTLAFSPDQCNFTSYGAPTKAACTTLLTNIANLGVGNTSYLFMPSQFPTPAGLSNGSRKDFPQSWSTTGCKAALVPIEVDNSSVTYDTSSYADIASAGSTVVQQCVSNLTKSSGGWELAGDDEDLVLHIYAAGSQIDATINLQTKTQIAATSEDQINNAEADDPAFNGSGDVNGSNTDAILGGLGDSTTNGTTNSTASGTTSGTANGISAPVSSSLAAPVPSAAAAASVVKTSLTFNYIACEADSNTARTLSSLNWAGTGLTVQRCAAYCAKYKYMGVEFGSECYCGGDANGKGVKSATIVTTTPNNCTVPCNGDATQLCGGDGWLSMYQNTKQAVTGSTA